MPPDPLLVTTTRATAIPLLSTETTIFRARKSALFLIVPLVFIAALAIGLMIVLGRLGLSGNLINPLRLGVVIVFAFIALLIFLDWFSTIYLLTNRRIQYRFGIVGEQTKTISLQQITDSRVVIGIFGRIFNYGDVVIDAANINSQIIFAKVSSPKARLEQIDDAKLQLGG